MSRNRHFVFTLLSITLLLIVLELITMAAFRIFKDRFTFYSADRYILAVDDVERITSWFDAGLGWSYHYDTSVFHKFMTGNDPLPVQRIKEFCASKDCLYFDSVETLASSVSNMEQIPRLYNVHVSAEGNRIIAERFAVFLEEHGLIR